MTPFAAVVDQSAARAAEDLAAIRKVPRIAKDMKSVVVVHTESFLAASAIRDLFCVNGIPFLAGSERGIKDRPVTTFEINPTVYEDAKRAILGNTTALKERAAWREFVFYFSFREPQ